jgi:hypothetical protein
MNSRVIQIRLFFLFGAVLTKKSLEITRIVWFNNSSNILAPLFFSA